MSWLHGARWGRLRSGHRCALHLKPPTRSRMSSATAERRRQPIPPRTDCRALGSSLWITLVSESCFHAAESLQFALQFLQHTLLVGYGGPKSFLSCVSVSVENRWYVWKHNNSFKIVFGLLGINTSPWSLFELNPLSRSSPGRVLQSNLRFLLALFAEEALLGAPLNSRKCPLSSLVFWDTDSYLSDALTKGFGALPSASAHTCLAAPPLVFTWKRFLWFFDVICLQERQTFPNPSSLNSFMINTSLSSFSAFSSCFRQQHWRTYFNICLCVF